MQGPADKPVRVAHDLKWLSGRLLLIWAVTIAVLLPLSWCDLIILHRAPVVAGLYHRQQDIPLLVGQGLLLAIFALAPPDPFWRAFKVPRAWPLALAMVAGVMIYAGQAIALKNYAMSVDELMAQFDAQIFATGRLLARVPPEWRDYAAALQPRFQLETAGHVLWSSSYLPVSAAFRGLGQALGSSSWVNPAWAAVALVAIAGVARRCWPNRPEAPVIAATLLATSPQFLVESMTAYSMPAHLALNLVWLWAYLRRDLIGFFLSLVVGFLATGLHQIVFHPLFVAPFIFQLWLDREWRRASLYTLSYAAICLFWVAYWTIVLKLLGATAQSSDQGGVSWFFSHAGGLIAEFDPMGLGSIGTDLLRCLAWQNVLMIPLALLAVPAAIRGRASVERSLLLGIGAMLLVVFLVMPYQDHGYGYRYLHGFLGALCLLATSSWLRWTDRLSTTEVIQAQSVFAIAAAAALCLSFPFGLWKAAAYVRPYQAAETALTRADTDIVFVDDDATWYVESLIRNDPTLSARPKLMKLDVLTDRQVRDLCGQYRIMTFDRFDALKFGIRAVRGASPNGVPRGRILMRNLGCGEAHITPHGA